MANTQVTYDSNLMNARSECCIAINPNNPTQIVSASKKFNNILTYDSTLATQYSDDGGQSWHDSVALVLPQGATEMTDPTLAWDDIGNVFFVGLTGTNPPTFDPIGIVIYKSTDGGQTWSSPNAIHSSAGDDRQWAAGDSNPASPFRGNVYAVWDDAAQEGIVFARTTDHGVTWTGPGGVPVGATISSGKGYFYPEIDVSQNGTIYVALYNPFSIELLVSSDGGDTFQQTAAPATGITSLENALPQAGGFAYFPGGTFRLMGDPTVCADGATVLVAWMDYRENVSRIYYARSLDSGTTWQTGTSGQPLLAGPVPQDFQHFFPQMVVDSNGVFGCAFYEFGPKPSKMLIDVNLALSYDGGESFEYLTVTDQPWDPTVDAPWAHGNANVTFIGDYMGLDASDQGFHPLWTDTRTGIQELWTDTVPENAVRAKQQAAECAEIIPSLQRELQIGVKLTNAQLAAIRVGIESCLANGYLDEFQVTQAEKLLEQIESSQHSGGGPRPLP